MCVLSKNFYNFSRLKPLDPLQASGWCSPPRGGRLHKSLQTEMTAMGGDAVVFIHQCCPKLHLFKRTWYRLWGSWNVMLSIMRHLEVFWGIMSDAIEVCENVLATHVRDEHLAQIWDRLTAEKIWGGEHAVFLKCSTNISTSSTIKFQNSLTFENHCFLFWLTR